MYKKEIRYDRETRDYGMYLDSELIGFARTYHEGEVTLDQIVFELLGGKHLTEGDPFAKVRVLYVQYQRSPDLFYQRIAAMSLSERTQFARTFAAYATQELEQPRSTESILNRWNTALRDRHLDEAA